MTKHESRIVAPTFPYDMVQFEDGTKSRPPEGWALLEPGDATLTRRVKAAGPTWTVQQKKGRKTFSHGVWAPAEIIEAETAKLEAERETPEYKARRKKDLERKARKHEEYVAEFHQSVLDFLAFDEAFADLADSLAAAVTAHATPVGSGTVARTKRISVEQRAEKAVIAWMRHQTTAYDDMKIPRVKGKRRQMRRMLAQRSRELLDRYRSGEGNGDGCPLARAIAQLT
jgi:hypothetical protein